MSEHTGSTGEMTTHDRLLELAAMPTDALVLLAHGWEMQVEELKQQIANLAPASTPALSLTIDHGSISLGCKPETIQLFVDRMTAAKVERALEQAAKVCGDFSCSFCENAEKIADAIRALHPAGDK